MGGRRLRGGGIRGKGRGEKKGLHGGWEGLEGEDSPGKFGKPLDRQMRQGPSSPKTRVPPPIRGRSPTPPSPLLTPICVKINLFIFLLVNSLKIT